jgi:hypothetical protein
MRAAGKQAGKTVIGIGTVPGQAPRRNPGMPSPNSDPAIQAVRYR